MIKFTDPKAKQRELKSMEEKPKIALDTQSRSQHQENSEPEGSTEAHDDTNFLIHEYELKIRQGIRLLMHRRQIQEAKSFLDEYTLLDTGSEDFHSRLVKLFEDVWDTVHHIHD